MKELSMRTDFKRCQRDDQEAEGEKFGSFRKRKRRKKGVTFQKLGGASCKRSQWPEGTCRKWGGKMLRKGQQVTDPNTGQRGCLVMRAKLPTAGLSSVGRDSPGAKIEKKKIKKNKKRSCLGARVIVGVMVSGRENCSDNGEKSEPVYSHKRRWGRRG